MTEKDLKQTREKIKATIRNDETYYHDPFSSEFCCALIDAVFPGDLLWVCFCLCGTQFSRMLADLQNGGSILEGYKLGDCASVANLMVLDDGYDSPIIVGSVVQNIIVWNIRWRCPLTGTLFQHCPTCSPKEGLIVLRRTTIFVKGCKNLRVDVHVFSQAGPKSMIYEHVLEPLSKAGIDGVSVDLDRHPHISSHNTRRPNMTVDAQCKKSTNALQRLEDTKIEARHRNAEKNGLGIEQLSNWKSVHDLGILSDQLIFATYDVKALQAVYGDGKATVEHLVESFVLRSKKYELDPIVDILDELPAYSQNYVKKNLVKIALHHQIHENEVLIYHILSYLGSKGHEAVLKKYGLTASEFGRMGGNASVKSSKHHEFTTAERERGGQAGMKSHLIKGIDGAEDLLKLDYVKYEKGEIKALRDWAYDLPQIVGYHKVFRWALDKCGFDKENTLELLLEASVAFVRKTLTVRLDSVELGDCSVNNSYNMQIYNKINSCLRLLVTPAKHKDAVRQIVHVLLKYMEKYKEQLSIRVKTTTSNRSPHQSSSSNALLFYIIERALMKCPDSFPETLKFYSCPSQTCGYKKFMDIKCMGDNIYCNHCKEFKAKGKWFDNANDGENLVLKEEEKKK